MRKIPLIVSCVLLLLMIVLSGCNWEDKIDEGTYICTTPYIKLTFDYDAKYMITQEIEIDMKEYLAIAEIGRGNATLYEYQEEDIKPSDGLNLDDNKIYANFNYKFDSNKEQLILTDKETGNVYHLDKVE